MPPGHFCALQAQCHFHSLLFLAEDYQANAHLKLVQLSAFSEGKEVEPEAPVEGS